jgi:hypothetical protein
MALLSRIPRAYHPLRHYLPRGWKLTPSIIRHCLPNPFHDVLHGSPDMPQPWRDVFPTHRPHPTCTSLRFVPRSRLMSCSVMVSAAIPAWALPHRGMRSAQLIGHSPLGPPERSGQSHDRVSAFDRPAPALPSHRDGADGLVASMLDFPLLLHNDREACRN